MSLASPELDPRARKNLATMLRGLAVVGLTGAAEAMGRDASTVSRMKDRELPAMAALLARCGLKVVPMDWRCYPQDEMQAILTLAKGRMARLKNAEELAEDDE